MKTETLLKLLNSAFHFMARLVWFGSRRFSLARGARGRTWFWVRSTPRPHSSPRASSKQQENIELFIYILYYLYKMFLNPPSNPSNHLHPSKDDHLIQVA